MDRRPPREENHLRLKSVLGLVSQRCLDVGEISGRYFIVCTAKTIMEVSLVSSLSDSKLPPGIYIVSFQLFYIVLFCGFVTPINSFEVPFLAITCFADPSAIAFT